MSTIAKRLFSIKGSGSDADHFLPGEHPKNSLLATVQENSNAFDEDKKSVDTNIEFHTYNKETTVTTANGTIVESIRTPSILSAAAAVPPATVAVASSSPPTIPSNKLMEEEVSGVEVDISIGNVESNIYNNDPENHHKLSATKAGGMSTSTSVASLLGNLMKTKGPKVPLYTCLAFGLGFVGPSAMGNVNSLFLLYFYTNVVGFSAQSAGFIVAISRIITALFDPLFGSLGDRTQRWYTIMLCGAVVAISSFIGSYAVSFADTNSSGKFWWYFGCSIAQAIAFSAFNVPAWAIFPLITKDYNQRTRLTTFASLSTVVGLMLSLVLNLVVLWVIRVGNWNAFVLSAMVGGIAMTCAGLFVAGTRPVVKHETGSDRKSTQKLWTNIWMLRKAKPFLLVLGALVSGFVAIQVVIAFLPYYLADYLKFTQQEVTYVAMTYEGASVAAVFLWAQVSKKFGKRLTYIIGASLAAVCQGCIFLIPPSHGWLIYIVCLLAGTGIATWFSVLMSMQSDTTDHDELVSGLNRKGFIAGTMLICQKLCAVVALYPLTYGLGAFGYGKEGVDQWSALLLVRITMSFVPGALILISVVFICFYPLTEASHKAIMEQLEQRAEERILGRSRSRSQSLTSLSAHVSSTSTSTHHGDHDHDHDEFVEETNRGGDSLSISIDGSSGSDDDNAGDDDNDDARMMALTAVNTTLNSGSTSSGNYNSHSVVLAAPHGFNSNDHGSSLGLAAVVGKDVAVASSSSVPSLVAPSTA